MRKLWLPYLRWRHSKGYGVHSPYAYRFVTDVLRPGKYGFYAYLKILSLLNGEEKKDLKMINLVKFTIRLAYFLQTQRIIIHGENVRFAIVASEALNIPAIICENCKVDDLKEGDILIATSAEIRSDFVNNAIKSQIPVFAIEPSPVLREIMSNPLDAGLFLRGRKKLLLVPRPEMCYTAYDINL